VGSVEEPRVERSLEPLIERVEPDLIVATGDLTHRGRRVQHERAADITSNSIWFWGFPDLTTNDLNHLIPVLLLVGTPLDVSTVHVDAGHWATIGNSGTRPAAVRGADIALTYEPNGGFSRVSVVPPGEAAFVFSAADTDVFLDPFSVAVPGAGLPVAAASPPALPGGTASAGSPTDELNYLIALGPVLSDVVARLGDFADGLNVADPSRPSDPIWSSLRGDADAMARDLANVQRLSAPPRYGGVQSELVSALQDLVDGMRNTTEGLLAGQPQRVSLGASELSSGAQKLDIARALLPM